jgi:hypothetical protein
MGPGETDDTPDADSASATDGTTPADETPALRIRPATPAGADERPTVTLAKDGRPATARPADTRPTEPVLVDTQESAAIFSDDEDDWSTEPDRGDKNKAKSSSGMGSGGDDEATVARRLPWVRRRRPGVLLPVVVIVVLLAAGVAVGRFVVPRPAPAPGAAPPGPDGAQSQSADQTGAAGQTGAVPPAPPTRPADALAGWAAQVGPIAEVPVVALQAYAYAQLTLENTVPACHLTWTTLAGVGQVESNNGQAGGAVLATTGRSIPPILGPALDGAGGRALVKDTDAGAFDGDATFDHAMGPLGIMPSVWRMYAMDADGDGIQDPYDVDDAALAMGRLLCAGNDDLSVRSGWNRAVARQHAGDGYAKSVFDAADSYGQRTRNIG